jgi:hypothetical protein
MDVMNLSNLLELFRLFPRYALHEKAALIVAIPLLCYVAYLVTAGRPTAYTLGILPASFGRTDDGRMDLRLLLSNDSGDREIHNVMGTFWIFGVEVARQSRPASTTQNIGGHPRSEYQIEIPLLPKSSAATLIEWVVVPPKQGTTGAIGWNFVSSETNWQSGNVQIVHDAKGRICRAESK